MAKAVVFDVGNVLYGWDIAALYRPLIADPERLAWFCREVVTPEWHFQHDAGRPFAETSAELIARFPEEADLIRQFGPRFNETIVGPIPGMLALVEQLAQRGVPLFGITNFSAEFWAPFRATAPVFDHFTDIIVSGAERLVKPDPAIYALALCRFGLAPGEAIFVDDRADNVAAGEANGFVGHLFTGHEPLAAELARLGLLAQ
ncbi:HAD family hydrolase [Sandarakinorhabdus oryzae]|uniref:HAD family hydrolase n=1 Tax=Sandarakinorhabdus oryzae TaxID=2675220 RepID=UPI0012E1FD3C|nr:HAD family phosphatase [Sandarakinorhabdus oryzae]